MKKLSIHQKLLKEVKLMSREIIVKPGKAYYEGGTVSKIAGSNGITAPQPMQDGVFFSESKIVTQTAEPSTKTEAVLIDRRFVEVPVSKLYKGGTIR